MKYLITQQTGQHEFFTREQTGQHAYYYFQVWYGWYSEWKRIELKEALK